MSNTKRIKGNRIYPNSAGGLVLLPGDYGKGSDGVWYARPPGDVGMGSLADHEVTEHEDGTITVKPSIWIDQPNIGKWHGFLKKGVWEEL